MPFPLSAKFPAAIVGPADLLNYADTVPSSAFPTLNTTITSASTSIVLAADPGSKMPLDNFTITLDDEEIFIATRSGATLSVGTRGVNGTTAAGHTAGVQVNHFILAQTLNQINAEIAAIQTQLGIGGAVGAWAFLGKAVLGAPAVSAGPITWTGTYRQIIIKYVIKGYSGGAVGRILTGASSLSTTALTNGSTLEEGIGTITSAPSIPGIPLAVTVSAIARDGWAFIDGASGDFKSINIFGNNGNPSVSAPPTLYRAAGFFSDLGTNLPLLQAQLSVYSTLIATALSATTFNTGTGIWAWGRNN